MAVEDGLADVEEFAAGALRVVAKEFEALLIGDRVSFHQDSLGSFDHGAPADRAFEVWYSAKRRKTISMALCSSEGSPLVIETKFPRFAASVTKTGSSTWSSAITGQAASRTIRLMWSSACSACSPSPTSATSGRSSRVTRPTVSISSARAITVCPSSTTTRENEPFGPLVRDQDTKIVLLLGIWGLCRTTGVFFHLVPSSSGSLRPVAGRGGVHVTRDREGRLPGHRRGLRQMRRLTQIASAAP